MLLLRRLVAHCPLQQMLTLANATHLLKTNLQSVFAMSKESMTNAKKWLSDSHVVHIL